MTTIAPRQLVERLGMALHDRLYRGSWRSWMDLEDDERGEYLLAARTCLDVLTAETRLCEPTDPLPRPELVEADPARRPVDPRTHGVGVDDDVTLVVRGRVRSVSGLSMLLRVDTAPELSPAGVTAVEVWIPAEAIVSATLTTDGP